MLYSEVLLPFQSVKVKATERAGSFLSRKENGQISHKERERERESDRERESIFLHVSHTAFDAILYLFIGVIIALFDLFCCCFYFFFQIKYV